MEKKKVLMVIEPELMEIVRVYFEEEHSRNQFDFVFLTTLEEANIFIGAHAEEIVLLVVDSFSNIRNASEPRSLPLVDKMHGLQPKTPIIGMSSMQQYRKVFLDHGCTRTIPNKNMLIEEVVRFLRL